MGAWQSSDQKDEKMEEQSVEESHHSSYFVGENETSLARGGGDKRERGERSEIKIINKSIK